MFTALADPFPPHGVKGHQLSVSNNQVDTASDHPLARSEPAEVVRLRMEVEFQLAKTAYE